MSQASSPQSQPIVIHTANNSSNNCARIHHNIHNSANRVTHTAAAATNAIIDFNTSELVISPMATPSLATVQTIPSAKLSRSRSCSEGVVVAGVMGYGGALVNGTPNGHTNAAPGLPTQRLPAHIAAGVQTSHTRRPPSPHYIPKATHHRRRSRHNSNSHTAIITHYSHSYNPHLYDATKYVTTPRLYEMDTASYITDLKQFTSSCTVTHTINNNINGHTNHNNNNNNNHNCNNYNNNNNHNVSNNINISNGHNNSDNPLTLNRSLANQRTPVPVTHHQTNGAIKCQNAEAVAQLKRGARREPLTIEEYETKFRQSATDLVLIERIFAGSIGCNQLRAALWPYLFGLILHRGRFERVRSPSDSRRRGPAVDSWMFVEHEANFSRWRELSNLYDRYRAQWESILPDQEERFSTFRERKSHIERDVVRCDRLHPFYADQPQNLTKLTHLLMTYMMYDFDIGYVQGMSDIAAPILCMYQGDLVKTFWVFVEVMKLFRRNFELTQKTIHFQLNCLYKLIKHTDPVFAQYLRENDSSNCFFAFRAIVCQFKRELMKEEEDDYSKVLFLWDTIWCVDRRRAIQEEMDKLVGGTINGYHHTIGTNSTLTTITNSNTCLSIPNKIPNQLHNGDVMDHTARKSMQSTTQSTTPEESAKLQTHNSHPSPDINPYAMSVDINQANSPRYKLTETEMFMLALCLSMIRRERDIIMARKLDGTDIHLHFINPKLAHNLSGFIEHAISIYLHLKNDFDLSKLTAPKHNHHHYQLLHEQQSDSDSIAAASPISTDGYDLLSDFLIIGGTSGSCMQIIGE